MITNGQRNVDGGNIPQTGSPRAANKAARRLSRTTVGAAAVLAAACLLVGSFNLIKRHPDGSYTPALQPPFIVGLNMGNPRADLAVFSAATGRPLTTVQPPRDMFFRDTAATSDGRTFIIAAESTAKKCDTWFYKLRLTAQGNAGTLTPFAIREVSGLILSSNGLSASGDGRLITYSAELCTDNRRGVIGVANALTGQVRTSPLNSESAWSLSLSPDGRVIGFVNTVLYGGDGSIRLLRADEMGRQTAVRVPVILPAGDRIDVNGTIAMSPDGGTILACSEGQKTAVLAAYNAQTGTLLGIVHTWSHVQAAPCELAYAPSGQYVLVYNLDVAGTFTKIDVATRQVIAFAKTRKYPDVLSVSW
jgi:WD40 repeat protein